MWSEEKTQKPFNSFHFLSSPLRLLRTVCAGTRRNRATLQLTARDGSCGVVAGTRNFCETFSICDRGVRTGSAVKAEDALVLRARLTAWLRCWRGGVVG